MGMNFLFLAFSVTASTFGVSVGFQLHRSQAFSLKSTALFYEIPKKGEKREVGRLLKNIIFPGIYCTLKH